MSKFAIGLLVGLSVTLLFGFTFIAENQVDCDVRIVNVDGHDYVIATSRYGSAGGCVAITHHVGCKRCNNNVSNER